MGIINSFHINMNAMGRKHPAFYCTKLKSILHTNIIRIRKG